MVFFNYFAKKKFTEFQKIINVQENRQYKFRTVVSEVSSFVGNPVQLRSVKKIFESIFKL